MRFLLYRLHLMLIPVILLGTAGLHAGTPFEGIISYKITYPGKKLTESQVALFPKALSVMIRGGKSRTDILTGGGSRIEITDHQLKTKIKLLSMMGQKYAITYSADDIARESAKEAPVSVELSSETKSIAGYSCKHAMITVNDPEGQYVIEVYYTPDLGGRQANFDKGLYKDIDGVLMEFSMKTSDMMMRFTATSVEKRSVSPKEFDIPADYTVITKDELKNKIRGKE